ncbi:hypothetical protein CAPTEDRAFT_210721 [Capitella teleta]|uniref:Uncharacterized protein n=1 Tax=Capitella teleta TaxID=283909 RepID=R7TV06_CAPTE|nr:hypothetical protein CAPTEDRAFT_210721 [Capitella teleta]|eukprot:ELT94825.1 hypothetical protein CAPTEDRAFT_210721 [Capitella teleta]
MCALKAAAERALDGCIGALQWTACRPEVTRTWTDLPDRQRSMFRRVGGTHASIRGALVWNENVRKNVERMQNEYGRWMWRLEKTVRNAAVHGESGRSSFWEREVKAKVAFVVRMLEEDGLVARVGRACLMEIGVRQTFLIVTHNPKYTRQTFLIVTHNPKYTRQTFLIVTHNPKYTRQTFLIVTHNPKYTRQTFLIVTHNPKLHILEEAPL